MFIPYWPRDTLLSHAVIHFIISVVGASSGEFHRMPHIFPNSTSSSKKEFLSRIWYWLCRPTRRPRLIMMERKDYFRGVIFRCALHSSHEPGAEDARLITMLLSRERSQRIATIIRPHQQALSGHALSYTRFMFQTVPKSRGVSTACISHASSPSPATRPQQSHFGALRKSHYRWPLSFSRLYAKPQYSLHFPKQPAIRRYLPAGFRCSSPSDKYFEAMPPPSFELSSRFPGYSFADAWLLSFLSFIYYFDDNIMHWFSTKSSLSP